MLSKNQLITKISVRQVVLYIQGNFIKLYRQEFKVNYRYQSLSLKVLNTSAGHPFLGFLVYITVSSSHVYCYISINTGRLHPYGGMCTHLLCYRRQKIETLSFNKSE